jgi:hypothetical protein
MMASDGNLLMTVVERKKKSCHIVPANGSGVPKWVFLISDFSRCAPVTIVNSLSPLLASGLMHYDLYEVKEIISAVLLNLPQLGKNLPSNTQILGQRPAKSALKYIHIW